MQNLHSVNGGRRNFLQSLGGAAASLALSRSAGAASIGPGRRLAGVFPIAFTPFTEDNKLDVDGLAAEVRFCNKGGVHGLVWPQLASAWSTLSDTERMDGTEAILSAGKGGKTALVIGVQSPDMAAITRYAKLATKLGADAIISLPPAGVTDEKALLDFYSQVGRMTELPLFAQSTGTMSVDLLVAMYKAIPNFRHVKDEAGDPLTRIAEIRRRTNDELKVFSGFGVQTMITEMQLGFTGHCPYTNLADVYSAAYDLWNQGKKREAFDMFGRIQATASIMPVNTIDVMIARGVFRPGTKVRTAPAVPGAPVKRPAAPAISHEQMRDTLKEYLGPYLKA
ncbi:MAG: 1-pyrroline-4-hydroxy-2-carboxylate deaminase [Bryobacterales bacterium]|jgi:4-hydroxy-tetrahydrodipicolinate synthase|nr:1-pyrroline-4-hydroxy-2-carboxylate deaminase [Bryobacterales bacterium]